MCHPVITGALLTQTSEGRKIASNVHETISPFMGQNKQIEDRDRAAASTETKPPIQQNFYGSGWRTGKAGKGSTDAKPMNRANLNIG